jgi:ABC-type antimicrobial peptide transport system permease subunit
VLPAAMFEDGVADVLASFVGVETASRADTESALTALREVMVVPERNDFVPVEYTAPIRPAEIDDAESMQDLPLVVGGVLVATAALGLSVAVAMSVRARRRDLATMRALGLTGGQVRRSVGVQVLTTVIAALAIGLPLGVVVGRLAWRAFAVELGVATEPSVPLGWIAVTIAGALVIAGLAAAFPARVAARTHPADTLRAE